MQIDQAIQNARQHLPAKRSFTIGEWCAMRGYSRPFFYTLLKRKEAPDLIGKGKAQRITDTADARWLKRQEAKAKKRSR
jgi:predicted DNA-binding transcriptional regulator AlpA